MGRRLLRHNQKNSIALLTVVVAVTPSWAKRLKDKCHGDAAANTAAAAAPGHPSISPASAVIAVSEEIPHNAAPNRTAPTLSPSTSINGIRE